MNGDVAGRLAAIEGLLFQQSGLKLPEPEPVVQPKIPPIEHAAAMATSNAANLTRTRARQLDRLADGWLDRFDRIMAKDPDRAIEAGRRMIEALEARLDGQIDRDESALRADGVAWDPSDPLDDEAE